MRIVAVIFTLLWMTFWFFVGSTSLIDTPRQIEKDKRFVETKIKPSVDFIKTFKKSFNRLPTNREFYSWERDYYKDYSSDLNQQVDSLIPDFGKVNYIRHYSNILGDNEDKFRNVDWTKDFAIGAWAGEWMEYYYSWNESYDTNNYSWSDGVIVLFLYCGVGLLPFIFLWRSYRRKKKSSIQHSHLCKPG